MTTLHGVDPRTGRTTPYSASLTRPDALENLLEAAHAAARPWAASTPAVRALLLDTLADTLDASLEELVPIAAAETGLPEQRLAGEVARTSGQLRMFSSVAVEGSYLDIRANDADPTAVPPLPRLRRWKEPLGTVLVYAASNFPFAFSVLGGDTASALAAGCPVLVKAHGAHPGTSDAVAQLASAVIARLGLPTGVFGVLYGDEQGLAALRDERVCAAGFTGSTAGGQFLAGVARERTCPIPFFGELGSVNPVVVTAAAASARGAEIAAAFVASMTLGNGQFCTKPGMLFLPSGHGMDAAIEQAVQHAAVPAPMLNARVRDQLVAGRRALRGHPAVDVVAEGGDAPTDGAWASAAIYRASATAVAHKPEILTAEYFGPNALIVEYADASELRAALQQIDGSLTATVHAESSDAATLAEVVDVLRRRAGRIVYNGWPTGVAVTAAMHHGGPWPAATDPAHTSVGAAAIERWVRPVCYQDVPDDLLPEGLRDADPWRLPRRTN